MLYTEQLVQPDTPAKHFHLTELSTTSRSRRGLIRVQLFPFVSFASTADIDVYRLCSPFSKWLRLPQSRDRVFFPRYIRQGSRHNWLFLMTVSLSRWRDIVTGLVSKFDDGARRYCHRSQNLVMLRDMVSSKAKKEWLRRRKVKILRGFATGIFHISADNFGFR